MSVIRTSLTLAIIAMVTTLITPTPAAADGKILGAGSSAAIPGRYLVALKDSGPVSTARALTSKYRAKLRSVYDRSMNGFSAEMSEADAKRLATDPNVAYVEQDMVWGLRSTQEFPPWGLDRIDQRAVQLDTTYSYEPGPTNVTAYVLDTGIRITHSDFGGRASHGRDFVDNDAIADDCHGHGTHVAGTIGGTKYGVAKNVKVVALRAFSCTGTSTSTSIQDALNWLATNAVKPAVVNLSIGAVCQDGSGHPAPCPPGAGTSIKTAVTNIIAAGVSVVVGAGNDNIDSCGTDLLLQVAGVIGVGATTRTDSKAPSSSWGTCIDLWAPGTDIVSAGIASDTDEETKTGTSFSGPHVAGAVALILARPGPAKTPAEVKAQLLAEATPNVISGLPAGSNNRLLYVPPPPVAGGSAIALARHQDGRLALFGANREGSMALRSQTQPNSDVWSAWIVSNSLNWYSACADTDAAGRWKLGGIRRNQEMWHRGQAQVNTNTFTNWQKFEDLPNSCAIASDGTKLTVFATAGDGRVLKRTETTSPELFTPWALMLAAPKLRSVAAERNGNGQVEVFGVTRTRDIWHCWEVARNCINGSGGLDWFQLDGKAEMLAAARNGNGALTLFAVNNGQLFSRVAGSGTNTWSAWQQLDVSQAVGTLRSLAAETNADGRITLVGVNNAGQIWQRRQTAANVSAYGPWTQIDGLLRP